jgi:competence protein ComEC
MGNLKISVLNVGHGDFIYAVTPFGQNLVIDCGSGGGDVSPSSFLSKITKIDELQISHPHTDHFDDIIAMSKKTINSFRCPSLSGFNDATIGWKNSDKEKIAKLRQMKLSCSVDDDAVSCSDGFTRSVWVPGNVDTSNPNTASYVTILGYSGFKMLFGGDLPDNGWCNLLQKPNFVSAIKGVNVFKVPHHGRKEGCSDELFKHIYPALCIISDKPIDDTTKNTVSTGWYEARTRGMQFGQNTRKVLSTRNDGSIFIDVESNGDWTVYPNTKWKQ